MKKARDLKKKLNLNRETLRSLDATALEQVAGGQTVIICTLSRCSECCFNDGLVG